jgi:hypothetical protein
MWWLNGVAVRRNVVFEVLRRWLRRFDDIRFGRRPCRFDILCPFEGGLSLKSALGAIITLVPKMHSTSRIFQNKIHLQADAVLIGVN